MAPTEQVPGRTGWPCSMEGCTEPDHVHRTEPALLAPDWPDAPKMPEPPTHTKAWHSTEYCPGCLHPFYAVDRHGTLVTHFVRPDGNLDCSICTGARPCQATIVAGRSGHAFARKPNEDKPRYRGLNRDGPVH